MPRPTTALGRIAVGVAAASLVLTGVEASAANGAETYSVSGVVVGQLADGSTPQPLAGACVVAVLPTASRGSQTVQTDSSGHYVIAGLAAGSYRIRAAECDLTPPVHWAAQYYGHEADGFWEAQPLDVRADVTAADIVLPEAASAVGFVSSPDDSGVSGATVTLSSRLTLPDGRVVRDVVAEGVTDIDGRFTLDGAPPGSYSYEVSPQTAKPTSRPCGTTQLRWPRGLTTSPPSASSRDTSSTYCPVASLPLMFPISRSRPRRQTAQTTRANLSTLANSSSGHFALATTASRCATRPGV